SVSIRNEISVNDEGDIDSGPNSLQNYPIIEWAEYTGNGWYEVYGQLDGNMSEGPWTIEVCRSSRHSSGHGGCLQSLGTVATSTNNWLITVHVPGDSPENLSAFTALATNNAGSTSEFGPSHQGVLRGSSVSANVTNVPHLSAEHGGALVWGNLI